MRLDEVVLPDAGVGFPPAQLTRGRGPEISALAYDSRCVVPGTLFFCVPGFDHDGHDFAADAVTRGAVALIVERPLGLGVAELVVPSVRAAMATAAARFHGDPSGRLRVAGVTGTNGKTTTAFLVRALLEAGGQPCGLLGTVKSVIGGQERSVRRTTPEAIDLQTSLAEMLAAGDRCCAMEVSSHALALERVEAIHFAVAVFTNLTQDHLDFHDSMEDYFEAKRRLFGGPGAAVVNVDDPYGRRLAHALAEPVTFGIDSPAAYRAQRVVFEPDGSRFVVQTPDGALAVSSPLPGRFNVHNALGAIATAHLLGVDLHTIAGALPGAGRVPGRFEPVQEGQDYAVLVDYAHTPDSLKNVLGAARGLGSGRLIVVFGCGGDRDRSKRPLMGAIAATLADQVIVTSDNPRSEDPEQILREIIAGVPGGKQPALEAEVDRQRAIERALDRARAGDVVLIAGKGHEQGQEFAGGRRVPFDDVAVARRALRAAAPA